MGLICRITSTVSIRAGTGADGGAGVGGVALEEVDRGKALASGAAVELS